MKIAARNKSNGSNGRHSAPLRVFGLFNWIKIWNISNNFDRIYGTTIDELAHASHWNMNHGKFNGSKTIVKESRAEGVEWHLTSMIYLVYSGSYWHYSRLDYTGIVQDMVEDFEGNRLATGEILYTQTLLSVCPYCRVSVLESSRVSPVARRSFENQGVYLSK